MKILLLSLLLILPASAQKKVWSWAPPNQNALVAHRVLASASMSTGLTVLVYSEINADPENQSGPWFRYRAHLVSSIGVTLASAEIQQPSTYPYEDMLLGRHGRKWEVLSLAKTGAALTDGHNVVIFRLKGKVATSEVLEIGSGHEASVFGSPADIQAIPCFLKQNTAFVRWEPLGSGGAVSYIPSNHITTIELWSLK